MQKFTDINQSMYNNDDDDDAFIVKMNLIQFRFSNRFKWTLTLTHTLTTANANYSLESQVLLHGSHGDTKAAFKLVHLN